MDLHGRSFAAYTPLSLLLHRGSLRRLPSLSEASVSVGVFAVALAAYLVTAPPSIVSNDSAELTTAAASLGIPHPPGYPLYVLVGHAFAALPVGDVGFRLNLMSAIFGALAAVAVYAIVFELTRHRISALVAALSLAFSYHFWGESLVAEVYTLDAALVGGLIYILCLWKRTQRPAALYVAFFLLGLSLAHRTTSLLLVPPLLTWGVMNGSLRQVGLWLRAVCCVLPGLALYLLLPLAYLAHPAYMWNVSYSVSGQPVYVDLTTRAGLTWYVTAKIFQPLAFAFSPTQLLGEAVRYLGWLWGEFAGFGVIIGIVGVLGAWRRHPDFLLLTAGAFVLQAAFYIDYAVVDKDQMLLPTYLVWSLWIGLGTKELLGLVDLGYFKSLAAPAARALALALPLALFLTNFPSLDFAGDNKIQTDAQHLFASAPPHTLVIGTWGDIASLQYFQTVKQERPDLTLIGQWALTADRLRELVAANIDERPIYLLGNVPALREDFQFVKAGFWYELKARNPKGGY